MRADPVSTASMRLIGMMGWRPKRPLEQVLRHSSLWVDGLGPLDRDAVKEHHKCGICMSVKSHPVS